MVLDSVIAIDMVGHGDSSLENQGKLGTIFRWDDGAKDVIAIIKHEIATTGDFQNNLESRNLIIGHSMGDSIFICNILEPSLFDAVIPIEAVIYGAPGGLENLKHSVKYLNY